MTYGYLNGHASNAATCKLCQSTTFVASASYYTTAVEKTGCTAGSTTTVATVTCLAGYYKEILATETSNLNKCVVCPEPMTKCARTSSTSAVWTTIDYTNGVCTASGSGANLSL